MDNQPPASRLKCQIDFSEDLELPQPTSLSSIDETPRFEDRYEALQTLGQGAHAIVKLAKSKMNQEKYAVKIVRAGDQEIQNNVKRTFNNTRCLRHANICQDIDLFINEKMETSYLVMEYCGFPSLDEVLKQQQKLSEEETRVIIRQLLLAIQHAHSKGICHRDLKPDNILVQLDHEQQSPTMRHSGSTLKVVDFGVSRRFISKGQIMNMVTKTGNIYYCAPEIYHGASYKHEVDIWAIGVIMFQCVTGRLPLYADDSMEFIELLGKPEQWDYQQHLSKIPLPAQNLITNLLSFNPNDRITIEDALEHPFFQLISLRDVMALVQSTNETDCVTPKCGRCKSLQTSLTINRGWDKLIKTIHDSEMGYNVDVDELLREVGNIYTIQKHGNQCNGLIQLMNSVNNSNILLSRLGSKQELLHTSMGYGSHDSIYSNISLEKHTSSNHSAGIDYFSDLGNVQVSQDLGHTQPQNNNFLMQFGSKMESSIDVGDDFQFNNNKEPQNKANNLFSMFDKMGIKEVDEPIEDH